MWCQIPPSPFSVIIVIKFPFEFFFLISMNCRHIYQVQSKLNQNSVLFNQFENCAIGNELHPGKAYFTLKTGQVNELYHIMTVIVLLHLELAQKSNLVFFCWNWYMTLIMLMSGRPLARMWIRGGPILTLMRGRITKVSLSYF